MPKKKWILSEIFKKNSLKIIEYLITTENEESKSLSDLAEILDMSPSSLYQNCRRLIKHGILIESNFRTNRSWAKEIYVDYENELVSMLVKVLRAIIEYESTYAIQKIEESKQV